MEIGSVEQEVGVGGVWAIAQVKAEERWQEVGGLGRGSGSTPGSTARWRARSRGGRLDRGRSLWTARRRSRCVPRSGERHTRCGGRRGG